MTFFHTFPFYPLRSLRLCLPGRCYAFELGLSQATRPFRGCLRSPMASLQSAICYGREMFSLSSIGTQAVIP